jgi:hypothetical protein
MQQVLRSLSNRLEADKLSGRLTDEEAQGIIEREAKGLAAKIEIEHVGPTDAWQYGEVLIAAKDWGRAERVLKIAVDHARKIGSDDRTVNDTLRLARAQAQLGKVKEAITTARTCFKVPDAGAAPILPATLLEIVPAAEGKGEDVELARLLEDAIAAHLRTKVDPESTAGKMFLLAKWHHIDKAWIKVIHLYQSGGRDDLAREAVSRMDRMTTGHQRV